MKTIHDPSQRRLFDPFEGVISHTGWKQIENGWQSMFRDVLLEQMPVQRVAEGMSESEGRPSVELHSLIGLLMIGELHNGTVPQTHEAILFRADIQYALNLEPGVDITQRTIERSLQKLQNDEQLSEELFTRVTDTLLRSLEVKVKTQRLDSTHVLSDMAVMGRVRMMGVALRRFFHQLKKHDTALLDQVPEDLRKRYGKASDSRIFGDADTTEKRRVALQQAGEVTACPAGHAPQSTRYNEKNDHTWAQMDPELCRGCPLAAACRVQKNKDTGEPNGRVQFRTDAPEAARRRRHEQTDEFRDASRWRSGIEGTNSCLKRRLGLGRLRVRGMKSVKLSVLLKLAGWNLLRATALRNHRLAAL